MCWSLCDVEPKQGRQVEGVILWVEDTLRSGLRCVDLAGFVAVALEDSLNVP